MLFISCCWGSVTNEATAGWGINKTDKMAMRVCVWGKRGDQPAHLLAAAPEHRNRTRLFSEPLPRNTSHSLSVFISPVTSSAFPLERQPESNNNNNMQQQWQQQQQQPGCKDQTPQDTTMSEPQWPAFDPLWVVPPQLGWNNKAAADPPVVDLDKHPRRRASRMKVSGMHMDAQLPPFRAKKKKKHGWTHA